MHRLTVEPSDPGFYTRITTYLDVKTALAEETQPTGQAADPTARRLIVSNVPLLASILDGSDKASIPGKPSSWKHRHLLSFSRGISKPSFMDDFVLSQPPSSFSPHTSPLSLYTAASLRLSTARRLAFNSQRLLSVYNFLTSSLLQWTILEGLARLLQSSPSLFSFKFDSRQVYVIETIMLGLGYLFVMAGLTTFRNLSLR